MRYHNESTLNHFKVVITREHGDDGFRAVITEPIDEKPMVAEVYSSCVRMERTTHAMRFPSTSYAGSIRFDAPMVVRLIALLKVVECVMVDVHQKGLEYDVKKAKRTKKTV